MNIKKNIYIFTIVLFFIPILLFALQSQTIGSTFTGKVSYYGYKLNGKKTANGERLDSKKFTAAHRTLPFGTMIEVQNPKNGKYCVVRVNDRGPYSGKRVLDLSVAAARHLGMINAGVSTLIMTVVGIDGEIILSRPTDFPYLEEKVEPVIPFLPKQ